MPVNILDNVELKLCLSLNNLEQWGLSLSKLSSIKRRHVWIMISQIFICHKYRNIDYDDTIYVNNLQHLWRPDRKNDDVLETDVDSDTAKDSVVFTVVSWGSGRNGMLRADWWNYDTATGRLEKLWHCHNMDTLWCRQKDINAGTEMILETLAWYRWTNSGSGSNDKIGICTSKTLSCISYYPIICKFYWPNNQIFQCRLRKCIPL